MIIYSINLQRLSNFYQSALAMALDDHDAGYHRLLYASSEHLETELVLLQAPADIVANVAIETPPVVRAATPIKPVFNVTESIAVIRERVEAAAGLFNPVEEEWSFHARYVCDGVDVEGNVFQVRSSVASE